MITLKQLDDVYYSLLKELEESESISTFEQRLMSRGVIAFMRRVNTLIDGNLDDMYDGSLQEEE